MIEPAPGENEEETNQRVHKAFGRQSLGIFHDTVRTTEPGSTLVTRLSICNEEAD